ncbi:VOC family protein [Petropleomorpha daqingensis]|uniref:Putative glyoxalase superfamily protein PhnB n=1 Tax=Petropleomorpha daqingensis TaxID=2026353 RepID=A0A853CHC3_9ACTN|nr:putative glyoxalase superfamily protein PhnB [Petropleomorpha daqingensis]
MFRDPQVNVYVADVEGMARFYRDVLGFTETFRTPAEGAPVHVELRIGALVVGMAGIEAARAMHGIDVGGDRPRAEVVLWTDDVDAAFEAVVAGGARPLAAPHDFLGSVRAAWVADPEGNPVELVMRRNG